MPRPHNPTAYWNRLDGKAPPELPHVISDIRMRSNECWVECVCGERYVASNPEALQAVYANHINYMKLEG